MILSSLRKFGSTWRAIPVVLALIGMLSFTLVQSQPAAAAYSCGTYSAGAYSSSGGCAAATPDEPGSGSGIGAPNTGFAKLMEPMNLTAIIGSLALLVAGIIIMLKSRSRKKSTSFNSRD